MHEDELHSICGGWPGVTSDIKWDHDRVYSVGGKMFCALALDGAKRGQLSFRAGPERFLELTDRPGVHPAPYLARAYWVSLSPGHAVPATEVRSLLHDAYRQVLHHLPKKQQRAILDLAEGR